MNLECSYGIIPLQKQRGLWMVLLIQHSSSLYWGFPKGHAEADELPQVTATRELKEETNLDVISFFSETALEENYQYSFGGKRIQKTVWYFVAEVSGDLQLQHQEVSDSRWLPLAEAMSHLTYANDKAILKSARALIE